MLTLIKGVESSQMCSLSCVLHAGYHHVSTGDRDYGPESRKGDWWMMETLERGLKKGPSQSWKGTQLFVTCNNGSCCQTSTLLRHSLAHTRSIWNWLVSQPQRFHQHINRDRLPGGKWGKGFYLKYSKLNVRPVANTWWEYISR